MSSNNSNSLKSQLEAKAAKVVVDAVARTVTNMLKGGTQPKSKEETTTPSNKTSSNNSNSMKPQLGAKATKGVVNTVARTVFGGNNTQSQQQQQPRSTKSQPEAGATKGVVGTVTRTVTNAFRGSAQTQPKSEKEIEAEMNFKLCELKHKNRMQLAEMNYKHEIELHKIALEHRKLNIYAEERRRTNGACERGCYQKRM